MFIVRTRGERPVEPGIRIALVRRTPSIVPESEGRTDLFCVGDDEAPDRLRARGWTIVMLHDGWYQGDDEGGVAIWGQGAFWEVRDTPFTVREAAGPAAETADAADTAAGGEDGERLDVRRGIFGV
jgi:hypothetical protein